MKSFIVLSALVAVSCAAPQFQGQYQDPYANNVIPILKQEQDISPDGSYHYSYETGNGIAVQEEGFQKNVGPNNEGTQVAQGSFSYTAPEGIPISLRYIADENGFRAEGAHLPTPPPIPDYIIRALEFIASRPQQPQPDYQQPQPFGSGFRG